MPSRFRLTTWVAAAIALIAITYAVRLSLDPRQYFFYRPEDRSAWVYHPTQVAFVCATMLAEAALVWGVFVAARPTLWLRCAIGLVILGAWALLSTLVVVHAPGYVLFHHLWLWSLVGLLMLAAFVSMVGCLHRTFRRATKRTADQTR